MTEVKGYLLGKVTQLISFTLSGHIFNPVHFLWTPMAYGTPGERFSLKAGQNFFGSKYWDRNASCLQHGQKKKRPIRNNSDIKYHFLKYPSWLRQRDQKEKKNDLRDPWHLDKSWAMEAGERNPKAGKSFLRWFPESEKMSESWMSGDRLYENIETEDMILDRGKDSPWDKDIHGYRKASLISEAGV